MEIVFRNPFYLWALLILPLIIIAHFFSIRYSNKRAIKFANFIALARISEKVGVSSNLLVLFLRVVVFIAIIFAIAGTSIWYQGSRIDADYVVAIDASASMLAEDFSPNRFDSSKDASTNFVDNLPIYSSVGLVSFAGTSYVNQPLTNDKILIKNAIDDIQIISAGGTDIGSAIITGTNLLMNSGKPRVIILLTDGRSNIGFGIQNALEYANSNNIIINTIGVGTKQGYFLDLNESLGPLGVNEDELGLIADSTKGKFYYPKSSEELNQIYLNIAKSEKTKVSLDLTFFLLIFILGALILEWVLINTRYKVIP